MNEFEIKDGVLVKYNGGAADVTVPDGIRSIGKYAFYSSDVQSAFLPDSVETIEESAFKYCENLQSIVLPESVTAIGEGAFDNCTALRSINIPNGVGIIGEYTFYNCRNLQSIVIPDSDRESKHITPLGRKKGIRNKIV